MSSELQQVKVTVVLDVPAGDEARADAVTYFIGQYGISDQGWALAEEEALHNTADAVEAVVIDVLQECFEDSQDWHPAWSVASSHVEVVK